LPRFFELLSMNTYFRILSYAKPWRRFVPGYLIFSLLAVLFGAMNMALLIPLQNVIFDQKSAEQLSQFTSQPEFAFSQDYVIGSFNHYMFQIVEEYGKFGSLIYVCAVIILSFLAANIFKYLSAIVMAKAKAETIRNMRIDIFKSVSQLHVGFFTEKRKGDIISRITNDIQQIESSITHNLKVIFREPLTVVVYFWLLIKISPSLTLFTLIMLPVAGIIISEIAKKLKKTAVQSQESLGKQLNILDETISGIRVIKAFNAVGYINKIFSKEVKKYAKIDRILNQHF